MDKNHSQNLGDLFRSNNWKIRLNLVQHPSLTDEQLVVLTKDKNHKVREAALRKAADRLAKKSPVALKSIEDIDRPEASAVPSINPTPQPPEPESQTKETPVLKKYTPLESNFNYYKEGSPEYVQALVNSNTWRDRVYVIKYYGYKLTKDQLNALSFDRSEAVRQEVEWYLKVKASKQRKLEAEKRAALLAAKKAAADEANEEIYDVDQYDENGNYIGPEEGDEETDAVENDARGVDSENTSTNDEGLINVEDMVYSTDWKTRREAFQYIIANFRLLKRLSCDEDPRVQNQARRAIDIGAAILNIGSDNSASEELPETESTNKDNVVSVTMEIKISSANKNQCAMLHNLLDSMTK